MSLQTVKAEVMQAYADCHGDMDSPSGREKKMRERNLHFKASEPVSALEAKKILASAVVGGYNEFSSRLLSKFPPTAAVIIAREGSVCLYAKPTEPSPLPSAEDVDADECQMQPDGYTRYWWD